MNACLYVTHPGKNIAGKPFITQGNRIFCGEQVHTYTHTCILAYTHTRILAYTHTCILAYTHTPMYAMCVDMMCLLFVKPHVQLALPILTCIQ